MVHFASLAQSLLPGGARSKTSIQRGASADPALRQTRIVTKTPIDIPAGQEERPSEDLVIEAYHHFYPSRQHHFYLQVLIATGLLVIVIALSSVTYLWLERPMQNAGRRVGRWLDARFGPDRVPGPVSAERRPAS